MKTTIVNKRKYHSLNNKLYRVLLNKAINQAGARYTPGLMNNAPNLQIQELIAAFDGLTRSTEFRHKIVTLYTEVLANKSRYKQLLLADITGIVRKKQALKKDISCLINTLSIIRKKRTDLCEKLPFRKLSNICSKILDNLAKINIAVDSEISEVSTHSTDIKSKEKEERLRSLLNTSHDMRGLVYRVYELSNSVAAKLTNNPKGLLLGAWGTGKTHSFCDIAKHRIDKKLPTIIILGHQFRAVNDPLQHIIHILELSCSKTEFFNEFNRQGQKSRTRSLLLIDAMNEGDKLGWRENLEPFLNKLSRYRSISIMLSCRTPFEKIVFRNKDFQSFVISHHPGFAEREVEAQSEFFRFYGIPNPEVPVLIPEFSRPLFLKLFCEALEGTTVKHKHKQIEDISAGLKGMTYIFEYFVDKKAEVIEKKLHLNNGTCWDVIKKMSAIMAQKKSDCMQEVICKSECSSVHSKLYDELLIEGLIAEDALWDENSKRYLPVVRFPYQKFSDHLIVRHLLNNLPKNAGPYTIRKLFIKESTLGYFFKDNITISRYLGIIESLIMELPNRIKNQGELFDYLPIYVTYQLAELFINGLRWRCIEAFNKSTNKWINAILNDKQLKDNMLDTLLILAAKPKHPYNAIGLHRYLRSYQMSDRDLLWSEFLRNNDKTSTIYRILDWIEKNESLKFSEGFAKMYLVILMWVLTSTVRKLRDRATRAIYEIGLRYPHIVFDTAKEALTLNDPYVPERMLAACYGIAMTLHGNPTNHKFRKELLLRFAQNLYDLLFKKGAQYGTTHILMRDYARFLIEIALLHTKKTLGMRQIKCMRPPFRDGDIRKWGFEKDRNENEYRSGNNPFGMDFANYTLGGLIPNRENYDFKNSEYEKVKGSMWWRIYNLGYSLKKFGDVDKEIANWNSQRFSRETNGGKVDRYGKKYCWIAFYELAGYRKDKGFLKSSWQLQHERISDCDIDPSFPGSPQQIKIVKTHYLASAINDLNRWIDSGPMPNINEYLIIDQINGLKGPWVLLGGAIAQGSYNLKRGVLMYPRAFFIANRDLAYFSKISNIISPNQPLPSVIDMHYTYAGEIPWCDTVAYYESPVSISVILAKKNEIVPSRYVRVKKIKPVKATKIHLKELKQILGGDTRNIEISIPKTSHKISEEISLNIPAEIPICRFNWEDHHSLVNIGQSVLVPSKELAQQLKLHIEVKSFKMIDENGDIASVTSDWGDLWHDGQKLIYFKKDLLDRYLERRHKALVWIIEGERAIKLKNYHSKQASRYKRLYKKFNKIVYYSEIIN